MQPATSPANRNDHFVPRFYLGLWEFKTNWVYAHWLVPPAHGGQIQEAHIGKLCQGTGYFDLVDATGDNYSQLDERIKPVESQGAPIVAKVVGGRSVASLSSDERERLLKWLACIGPLGPNGKQSCIASGAAYLLGVIESAAVEELGKYCKTPEQALARILEFRQCGQRFVAELRISAQLFWQFRAFGLISLEYRSLSDDYQWIDFRRPKDEAEAFTTDCIPQITILHDKVMVATLPLGPDTILVGLPKSGTPADIEAIRMSAWSELRNLSIAQASMVIIGHSADPTILPLHHEVSAHDPRLNTHRAREATLREPRPLTAEVCQLTISAGSSNPLGLLDSEMKDSDGNSFVVRIDR